MIGLSRMAGIRPTPGGFLWLAANDMRLNWRRFAGMLGAVGKARPWLIAAVATIVSHALAWPVARWLGPLADAAAGATAGLGILAGVVLSVFSWMIAQSLFGTMRVLYDRGDLDLLLGSPLPASRIFAAKAAAVVASTLGSIAVLALPLVNALAFTGRPEWLGAYPTLLALGLIATALAILIAIGLFFLLGARRARLVMQLTGAAIGGGFVLGAQIVLLLPEHMQDTVLAWFAAQAAHGSILSHVVGLPVAAMAGHASSIILLLAVGLAAFAAAVAVLAERFAKASLEAAGVSADTVAPSRVRCVRFRTGPGPALRRKEWRLLARDPGLFAQISLQIIYTIPLVIVLLKSGSLPIGVAVAPSLVVIIAQVAASLSWIAVSGEDAPELIASAPVATSAVDRSKLLAIAVPVLGLLAPPVALLALVAPLAAVVAAVLAIGASVSTALLNLWHPMPGNRRGMLRRHAQSKLLALIEHIIAVLWAVAAVLALLGTAWCVAPIALALAVLAVATPQARPVIARWVPVWPAARGAATEPNVI